MIGRVLRAGLCTADLAAARMVLAVGVGWAREATGADGGGGSAVGWACEPSVWGAGAVLADGEGVGVGVVSWAGGETRCGEG